jgi:hypothetical protein
MSQGGCGKSVRVVAGTNKAVGTPEIKRSTVYALSQICPEEQQAPPELE